MFAYFSKGRCRMRLKMRLRHKVGLALGTRILRTRGPNPRAPQRYNRRSSYTSLSPPGRLILKGRNTSPWERAQQGSNGPQSSPDVALRDAILNPQLRQATVPSKIFLSARRYRGSAISSLCSTRRVACFFRCNTSAGLGFTRHQASPKNWMLFVEE